MQGVQVPSFDVDPSRVAGRLAERLWKPLPAGQVMLVMFWHSVGESGGYCPGGHMKTQQTPLMVVLPGWHGGEVLFVVAVVLQPIVVHDPEYKVVNFNDACKMLIFAVVLLVAGKHLQTDGLIALHNVFSHFRTIILFVHI